VSKQPVRAIFAIPGDLATPTGGYAYDRRVLALLGEYGIDARLLTLPGSFPRPGAEDLEITRQALSAVSPDDVLLIDGLAWGAMPVEIAGALGAKIVALCHHPLGLEAGLTQAQANALVANETMNLAFAAKVVVTSHSTRATLIAQFGVDPEKIVVAEPGTDPAPRAIGGGSEVLNILAVGSIVQRKGYDLLVEALAGLQDFNWRLRIVGALDRAPDCVQALRAQIAAAGLEERIILGGATDAELDALYHNADVFVSASRYEGYGMVLTEAMARGLPIIASTGGAAADTLPDGAGLKIPPNDAPALREALRRALSDSALRTQLANAASAAALNLPGWNDAANIIAQTLRAVADGDSK
jgi:glycosyltransferase involved in cell wall biosynthesis